MAEGKFTPKPRDKNLLDSKRIVLSVPCPVKGVKGFSELHFYANNDNPGITVYTRDPADKDNNFGRIQAKFGILDFQVLMEQLKAVTDSKEPIKLESFCQSPRGQDKKKADVARVEVGKNPGGVVYIMVEDLENSSRPKIYFPFAPTYWHHLARNGERLSEAETSVLVARGLYNLVTRIMTQVSVITYKHPEPKQPGGGGGYGGNRGGGGNWNKGGGNNNRGSSGGGGWGNDSDDSDSSGGGFSGGGGSDFEDISF
uniref:Single-stranded DNA-binding protein n=1 Tax=Burkholderia phage vB_BgluM-SURPRISE13 TaxID=3159457 RepID=A0AAU7PFU1_9VIRU